MSRPAIIVDGLGKKYKIGVDRRAVMRRTFREAMVDVASYPIRRFRALGEETTAANEFWALKDVSFEVQPGEVVGIIGRNGAGKSTLLKILSRITEPTKGRAEIRGRVGSLLEVGTGFHQELTGRENIYLNGAILGMRKAEIDRKFDQVVAFAEVGNFLDTPVKRYSSGMYVRLAFAVAAHLEPNILIVDEVLAVGDAQFQKKCLGKMGHVAKEGRTILFVSHNMGAVSELCERVIHLAHGTLCTDGPSGAVIAQYLRGGAKKGEVDTSGDEVEDRSGEGPMRITRVAIIDSSAGTSARVPWQSPLTIEITIRSEKPREVHVAVGIRDVSGRMLLNFHNSDDGERLYVEKGDTTIIVEYAATTLNVGDYYVSVHVEDQHGAMHDRVGNCLGFEVDAINAQKSRCRGVFRVPCKWNRKDA